MPLVENQSVIGDSLPSQSFVNEFRPPLALPYTQQLAWLMVRPASFLEEINQQLLIHICQDPTSNQVYNLAKEFTTMVRGHQVEVLDDWLIRCQNASTALLQQFGLRFQQDYDAVRAALSTEWSNGQTEGQPG